jgi:hypothetical protein
VQVVEVMTGEPLKLDEGQQGYVFPIPVASETHTPVLDNPVVRFTTDGKTEIRVPSGRYWFTGNIPLGDYSESIWQSDRSVEDYNEQNPVEVRDGETYSITLKMSQQRTLAPDARLIPSGSQPEEQTDRPAQEEQPDKPGREKAPASSSSQSNDTTWFLVPTITAEKLRTTQSAALDSAQQSADLFSTFEISPPYVESEWSELNFGR